MWVIGYPKPKPLPISGLSYALMGNGSCNKDHCPPDEEMIL